MGYWKPTTTGNPGVNPIFNGPASRQFQQTGGNPGVNPAFNGPAQRLVNQRQNPAPRPVAPARPPAPALSIADRARLRIAAMYDPVIKQISDEITARTRAQQDSIFGYSRDLAGEMQKYVGSARDIYAGAQQSQAAADIALAQRLTGGGSQLASELSSKLGAINAPGSVVSEIAGGAATTGQNAGNAAYARGTADLTRLIAQGAAAQEYASKQPGFVIQRGQQDIAAAGAQGAQDIQNETSSLRAKIPGDVMSETDRLTSERDAKLAAKQKAKQDRIDKAWEAATLKVAYGIPLTAADKRALKAGYGSNPDAVAVVGKQRQDEAERAAKAAADAASAAQKALIDANLEAQKQAGKTALQRQKDAASAARAKKAYWRARALADRKHKQAIAAAKAAKNAKGTATKPAGSGSGPVTADGITGP